MRQILFAITITLLATFTLAACGTANNDIQSNDQQDITEEENTVESKDPATNDDSNTGTATDADQNDMQQQMEALDYTEFELEVKYAGDQEYEAKIDYDDGRLDADLDDDFTNVDIEGKEAFDKIYPIVEALTIDQNTAKEAAIDEILQAFDLDSNYEKFELEITFNDGTKIEFED